MRVGKAREYIHSKPDVESEHGKTVCLSVQEFECALVAHSQSTFVACGVGGMARHGVKRLDRVRGRPRSRLSRADVATVCVCLARRASKEATHSHADPHVSYPRTLPSLYTRAQCAMSRSQTASTYSRRVWRETRY